MMKRQLEEEHFFKSSLSKFKNSNKAYFDNYIGKQMCLEEDARMELGAREEDFYCDDFEEE